MKRIVWAVLAVILVLLSFQSGPAQQSETLDSQRQALFDQLQKVHGLTPEQVNRVRRIFQGSAYMGQGNPVITQHPVTREECRAGHIAKNLNFDDPSSEKICGAKYMAPLIDPDTQTPQQATQCIDRFEFPNIPCEYPVIWVRANEAADLCEAVGKRLCDAHEWESGCAGKLEEPDYRFDLAAGKGDSGAVNAMRNAHNAKHSPSQSWSYGPNYQRGICGASSAKSPKCSGGNWNHCGSNTYPAGHFTDCHSSLGVYDINGNAAEHMNLPLDESQMASKGSKTLGVTEMKGSWFIFDTYRAHPDWCRWRAPYWHGSRVMVSHSHANYHLGFRCCKTIESKKVTAPGSLTQ